MKLSILAGSTSQTVNVFIQDSSSTTGAGLTGLVYNSGSLTAYYALPRAAAVSITLATQTVTGAYSSGGFVEISSANMPGWYRLDVPDAALASGRFVSIHLKGATNMAPLPIEIELTAWNNQDAVHGGMSALPNTACTTNASLLTSGTGTDQLSVTTGKVDAGKLSGQTITAAAGVTFPTSVASPTNITAGTITTVTNLTNAATAGDFTTVMKTSLNAATPTVSVGQIAIKKNTALSGFTFLMVDSANVPVTGLSITAQRSIDGAAVSACTNAATEISGGLYKINLAAADLNGNFIMLIFSATGAQTRYVPVITQV